MAEEPTEGAVVERKPGEGEEDKSQQYCKELSEEQLKGFYEISGNNEEAVKFMALEILKLPDFTYEGNIAMILDYFVGILMFAQEEQLSAPQTLLMYQLAMETLEKIKTRSSMKKTENAFKDLIFRWSVKVKNTNHVPLLTTVELQKIVPFFMDTVFQHYRLFCNCFNRESLHWRYYEEVYIQTPMIYPLNEASTKEEIDQDKQAKSTYEKAWAEWEAARLAAEARARWLLENPPEPRRPPNNLDEYIDFAVRDKVEEVMKVMQEQYEQQGTLLFGRVQTLEAKK